MIVEPVEVTDASDAGPQGFATAFFHDGAYVNFQLAPSGAPQVLDIMAGEVVRGRHMLDWLKDAHGLPEALDVVPQSEAYWKKMISEGRISAYLTVAASVGFSIG
jgi:hypothetical protein